MNREMVKRFVCLVIAVCMVLAITVGCGKKKEPEKEEPSTPSNTQKIDISIGAVNEGEFDESKLPQSKPEEFTPGKLPQSQGESESDKQEEIKKNPIPGSGKEESKGNQREVKATRQSSSKAEFKGLTLPLYENWTSYPLEETKYFCGGMGECYTVEPAQKYEVNNSLFGMFYGGTANYARMQVVVLDDKTAIALMHLNPDGVPYLLGHIYTLEGEEPLLFRIENYTLTEEDMWEYIWSVVQGLGIKTPKTVEVYAVKGKQEYTEKKKLQWQPTKNYKLPKLDVSVREDLKYALPVDWKLVEINGVVSSNSENGKVRFEMAKYESTMNTAGEFGNLIGGYVNNNQAVTRLKSYEDPKGISEVVAVGSEVMLFRIYSNGERVYRCVVSYNADAAEDYDKWLALQVFGLIEYAGETSAEEASSVPTEYGGTYEIDENGNPIIPELEESELEESEPESNWDTESRPEGTNPSFDGE